MFDELVVVRGGGDLGTGTALRLWRAGFDVLILEATSPMAVRRTVSFSEAVYEGSKVVEDATAVLVPDIFAAHTATNDGLVPVLVDPAARSLGQLGAAAVVDAILAKRNTGTRIDMGRAVVALGPGFDAGRDAHAVVETNRGPNLGRVIWKGAAAPNTGQPAAVRGHTDARVLRAPREGVLTALRAIEDVVDAGEVVATVNGEPVRAGFKGMLRGLLRDGSRVRKHTKIGDIDPREDPTLCRCVSDKSLAIAGGVLEAVLARLHGRRVLQ